MSRSILFMIVGLLTFTSAVNANVIKGPGLERSSAAIGTSDFDGFQKATGAITLGPGQQFLRVTFWGAYEGGIDPDASGVTDAFTIRIWGPASAPGTTAQAVYDVANISATRTPDGTSTGGDNIYQYVYDFDPLQTPNITGGSYFLSIVNSLTISERWLWWAGTGPGSGQHYVRDDEASTWLSFDQDPAFLTEHAPEPGSIGLLSVAALGLAYGAWRRRKRGKQSAV